MLAQPVFVPLDYQNVTIGVDLFVAPYTLNPWGHVELVSKDVGIG